MAKSYSFYAGYKTIKVLDSEVEPPIWRFGEVWVSVRLENTFYGSMAVQDLTKMFKEVDVKREDAEAYFIPEFQVSDAVKKGFVHKLNMTLVPQAEGVIDPNYGPSYKTTLVVAGDQRLDTFIPQVLYPFVWNLGPNNVPYISKPNSISTVGGRKNKERY